MDDLINQWIIENLLELFNKNTCCIFFIGPFYKLGIEIDSQILKLGLKTHNHIINGHFTKRIYNQSCCHCIDSQPSFHLADQSKREILYLLKFSGTNERSQDARLPSAFKSTRLIPVLPANRFTIAPIRPNTFHSDAVCREMVPSSWRLYPFKWDVLKCINEHRVLVINGDTSFEKSTSVPLTIVEECIARQGYCKVLCVESDNLMAILNSNFVADHLNERIGSRVGFQVYLQSRVCDNTNIIYTTAIFFLRVLMGQDPRESFRYITHIVISDVHLHNAFKDIFMKELKTILPHYPFIKIILLSDRNDNRNFLSYFGEGQELRLSVQQHKPHIYHLEEIAELIKRNESPQKSIVEQIITRTDVSKIADEALQHYNTVGDDTALVSLMELMKSQQIPVNYAHSKGGYTALISAVKHDNPYHVKWLLSCKNANRFHQDRFKINALEYAISINSLNCIQALINHPSANQLDECKPPPIDFEMIIKLIRLIANPCMTATTAFGNILVFLPTFDHLLKLHYAILKNQFLRKIHEKLHVHLIHPNMQPEQLQQVLLNRCPGKIILATEMAENLSNLNDIAYVIDAGQIFREKYDLEFKCSGFVHDWISQESFERRSLIASRLTGGYCFRLISRKVHDKLHRLCPAELCHVPLNRLALTIKLLSPGSVLTEYFQETISKPPAEHVAQSIQFLKNIEALDENLAVTWLGCRLVDIPMNLELGKSLVMSILFKCLDPVLTIVSFLTYSSSLRLFKYISAPSRQSYSSDWQEDCFSDHLEFLRLYHLWQDEKRTKMTSDVISDEKTFILNGILENVCELRTNLVGALRSSQLIHNQGVLSMHSINLKANNWAVIKASLAAGLYPKFCMINFIDSSIKSKTTKLRIDPSSVLHPSRIGTFKSKPPSNWIVYFRETNGISLNSISNCSLISTATIALFAGKSEINPKNVFFTQNQAVFFIDNNIWLLSDIHSVLLTLRLRELFYESYLDFLQNCANVEKWKKTHEMSNVFDVMSKILLQEDKQANFPQPYRVGNRPKAFVNKFTTSEFDFGTNLDKASASVSPFHSPVFLEKEFFLITMFDSRWEKSFWKLPTKNVMEDQHLKRISYVASREKLTFVVVCSATRKQITNIALVRCDKDAVLLKNSFHVNIPLHEVIITCTALKFGIPPFNPDSLPRKINKEIGEIILELWENQNK